ncbi:MAG: DNA repair protein RecN (Recombination protein N) [Myxococcota bacterium]|jgi:DNA repair protein RecN (Recombination protein N)
MTRPMLTSIRIQNLALIDDVEIRLEPGLTVLTGETGAGKSVIVGALSLILGDRANAELIRQGLDEGEVEALFHLRDDAEAQKTLMSRGLAEEDGTLVMRRVLSRSGRNRVYLNGRLSTLSDLRAIVGPLVDISSQHAHTSLLRVAEHREILDRFGDLDQARSRYDAVYAAWHDAAAELDRMVRAARDRTERGHLLRFQLAEIDEVEPCPGEEDELVTEREVLRHADGLRQAAETAQGHIGNSVLRALGQAELALRVVSDQDPEMASMAERVEAARLELEDVSIEARDYRRKIKIDPRRLDQVEDRIAALRRLTRKHGPDLEDVLIRRDALRKELAELETLDGRLEGMQAELDEHHQKAIREARVLTKARRTTGRDAGRLVEAQLADLGMPGAQLVVQVDSLTVLGPQGADRVEFLLSANTGEEPLPLAKIASGGELSRIMLALKRVLASANTVDCYVFDEVDTGVSGAIADRIGVKLRETAARRQALCITHLPQVACHAEHQLRVHKEVVDGRTVTRVSSLHRDDRLEEIARLLAGAEVTDQARAHAAELLKLASNS